VAVAGFHTYIGPVLDGDQSGKSAASGVAAYSPGASSQGGACSSGLVRDWPPAAGSAARTPGRAVRGMAGIGVGGRLAGSHGGSAVALCLPRVRPVRGMSAAVMGMISASAPELA